MERLFSFALIDCIRAFNVQIHNHRILSAPDDNGFARPVGQGVHFLVRHVRRNVNEIPRSRLVAELQMIAPSHPGPASHDVDNRFEFAVMMRAGFRMGLNNHGACP